MQQSGSAKFKVRLAWQDATLGFSDVSGLGMEVESQQIVTTPSHAATSTRTQRKQRTQRNQLGLQRGQGVFAQGIATWLQQRQQRAGTDNEILTLTLTDASGQTLACWRLHGCEIHDVRYSALKSDASEVAIESLHISYDSMQPLL